MSDDATIRIGPEQPPRRRAPGRGGSVIGGVVAALILAGFVALGDARPGRDGAGPGEAPAAAATETGASTSPTGAATDPPSDAGVDDPTDDVSAPTQPPSLPTEAEVRRPRAVDVRAFLSAYDARHGSGYQPVAVDTDRDGLDAYEVVFSDEGGTADRLEELFARDLRAGAGLEIGTRQSTGTEGSSVSLWGLDDGRWAREAADGGCWDGSHTYGLSGAVVQPGRITATCDAFGATSGARPSDVYVWDGRTWAYRKTVEPGD